MARRRVSPQTVAELHAVSRTVQTAMLDVQYINPTKGKGVFALSPFQKVDFVVEYRGQFIYLKESERRRRRIYNTQCLVFMFDFMWHGKKWCIDAAMEDGSLGRLVNNDHVHPNCRMKRVLVGGKPHLCLFAARDIHRGEEITYDYGDSNWPWREKGGGDSSDIAVENHILPCSSNPVVQQEEVSPLSLQGDGDSDIAVENHILPCSSNRVMQQEEVSPLSLQGGSGDSFVKDLETSSSVCSSSVVLQDKDF
ncbi:histone-lysine N-methyltransferase set-1-like [Neoarius graeffei]|uniref:histone-lysine N-methyltransferase set-1-like n=1 Tax=Neoarius graeffei TaxID=443677 RepID=UPI00298D4487|nr:histone-lysine N-methyltransferase set-1-like [Neoarius graeffei]XP_060797972.1 histone-lysine N-methyltransferase set-1-like [Neoarius graeffei]